MNITKLAKKIINPVSFCGLKVNNYHFARKETKQLASLMKVKPMSLSTRMMYMASNMGGPKDPKKNDKKLTLK